MRPALLLALLCTALPLRAQPPAQAVTQGPAAAAGGGSKETAAAPLPAGAEAAPVPTPAPAATSTVTALPALSGGSRYRAPASLPPVTAQLFHVGGLFEVEPLLLVSVGDPFWRTVGAGLRVEQHLDERWSVAAHAIGALSLLSAPVEVCGDASCGNPGGDQLRSTPGKLQLLAGLELGWAPIYGKLSLVGETTVHFDAYLSAGPELVRERIAQDAATTTATSP